MRQIYKAEPEQVTAEYSKFMKEAPPFRPFIFNETHRATIADLYANILTIQNGEGVDDYGVNGLDSRLAKYLLRNPSLKKVLLLGVGPGREILLAKSMGFDATGITLGSRNIDMGRLVLGLSEKEHIEAIAESLPFPSETFDAVIGCQVFEHTIAPIMFLLEIGRVLKPNGKLILEWPSGEVHTAGANPHHLICYAPGQGKALLRKTGFENVETFYTNGQPIPKDLEWNCNGHDIYVCVEGTKGVSEVPFIKAWWNRILQEK